MRDDQDDGPRSERDAIGHELREETVWPPFAFRYETTIPLPTRRDPRRLVMRMLEGVLGGVSWVSPGAFAKLGEAVSRCDAGDLEGSLAAANRAAEEEPALRPLALVIARMCVHKELGMATALATTGPEPA